MAMYLDGRFYLNKSTNKKRKGEQRRRVGCRWDIGCVVLDAAGYLEVRGKGPNPTRLSSNNYIRE